MISRVQARRGGMSEDEWQWRLDSGRWQSVLYGVAVAHSGGITLRQRAWAGVVFPNGGASLSADVAMIEHGVKLPVPTEIHVVCARQVVPQRYCSDPEAPVVRLTTHRAARVAAWSHPVKQPPVLRLPYAVLHAAAWAPTDRAAEWRVAAAVQQRRALPKDLRAALVEMPRLERRRLIRDVLDDVELGAHAASELDFLRFLRRHGLPLPDRMQRPVRTGTIRYLDAWWARQRVNAEMDGAHHRMVGTWDDDALRANDVVLVERHDRILLLRFTRANLRHDGERVARQLRDALL